MKMSKSSSTTPNIEDTTELEAMRRRISALQSEVNYWKLRHELQSKYCTCENKIRNENGDIDIISR
jgi:hypothetical protein